MYPGNEPGDMNQAIGQYSWLINTQSKRIEKHNVYIAVDVMPGLKTTEKYLAHLLTGIHCTTTGSAEDVIITGLSSDSRTVKPGDLFGAVVGLNFDGHDYIDQAIANGCSALLVNKSRKAPQAMDIDSRIAVVEVDDTRDGLGLIAANYFDHPGRQLKIVGITGTNGKTTTSYLVEGLLRSCGMRTGVIGTVNYRYVDENDRYVEMAAPFTTPEPIVLHSLLKQMLDQGITHVVMEVSSHALAQKRIAGLFFDLGVFTNLSREHLDFHIDMNQYFASKKLLFTNYLKPDGQMVIMQDQDASCENKHLDWGSRMSDELQSLSSSTPKGTSIITCGVSSASDIHPRNFSIDLQGIKTVIETPAGDISLQTPLVGEFNLRNILCAAGIGIGLGYDTECMQKGLEAVKGIPGRLERVSINSAAGPVVFVDYAHTPDALKNVLTALHELKPNRLVCIFGCGGDRDPGKRPLMGEIAGQMCDVVVATSDNPRSESPNDILMQIEKGLSKTPLKKQPAESILHHSDEQGYAVIVNRQEAIERTIRFAQNDDVILISGKGHEDYQISATGKRFFDDRLAAEMQLHARAGHQPKLSVKLLQQITGGALMQPITKDISFNDISTDSRTIKPGNLFVALTGENFNGTSFAKHAVGKGATGLLISHTPRPEPPSPDFEPQVPVIMVNDTLRALGDIADHRRSWYQNRPVIAITGSSGKTTVKEMTSSIVGRKYCHLKTEGNFNNLIGLPLTLLQLKPEHEVVILEMGMNSPGEIARLTEIADPDIACINNIQEAHLEGLGDIQGVARAKNELFAGLKPGSKAVVNLDDNMVRQLAKQLVQEKITYGLASEAMIRATDITSLGEEGMSFTLHIGNEQASVTLNALGRHNVSNSLAAAAMAYGLGMGITDIAEGLASFSPYDKRSCLEKLTAGLMVLNDSYNANPSSMLAALHTIKEMKKNHRAVAVLGDMLELGSKSDELHRFIGSSVARLDFDYLAAFGPHANKMVAAAVTAGMDQTCARSFNTKEDLADWLIQLHDSGRLSTGDWLLIKGSRGMQMETVLEILRQKINSNLTAGN
jgi:murE/murF fusion protein